MNARTGNQGRTSSVRSIGAEFQVLAIGSSNHLCTKIAVEQIEASVLI